MPPDTMDETPENITPDASGDEVPTVRVTIDVAGLREMWEYPFVTSALQSALAAIEAVHMELNTRHQMAQQLESELGDRVTDPDYDQKKSE